MLAELADLPQSTNVIKIAGVQAGKLTLHRGGDTGTEVIEMTLPGVVTVNDSLTVPRFVTFRGIMQARKKPLDVLDLAGAGISADKVGVDASHTKVLRLHVPEARQVKKNFVGDEAETTKQVLDLLVNEAEIFRKNT
jgi:electron transfer flavoprotein beta subunit